MEEFFSFSNISVHTFKKEIGVGGEGRMSTYNLMRRGLK